MSFIGTTNTDFMKLPVITDDRKAELIDYSIADFYDIRAKLIKYLRSVYPNDFTNFSESDFGVMFMELIAYVGATLSHKSDMLANESYLRTVKNRNNLNKLLELIGVVMQGPTSANGQAKITFTSPGSGPYVVAQNNRVLSVPSELDGKLVSYTLYKVVGGVAQQFNSGGSLSVEFTGNASQSVYSDFILVEGALVVEQGVFTDTDYNKRIALSKSPVIDGSVSVYISDNIVASNGIYTEKSKLFFASGGTDKIFSVESDASFNTHIQFGDNVYGISPGRDSSYTISYRVGGGPRGNQKNEAINAPITITSGGVQTVTATLENYSPITGGTVAESVAHAKRYYPKDFARQNRLVTLEDYSVFINTFKLNQGSIGKSTAVTRRAFSSANIIDVYILEKASDFQLQRATTATKNELLTAIGDVKMLTDQVVIGDGIIRTLDLNISIKIDRESSPKKEAIKLSVAARVLDYFNVDKFDFGTPFIPGELNRVIFQTKDVRYSSIDNVSDVITVDFNEIIQLNNFTINVSEV